MQLTIELQGIESLETAYRDFTIKEQRQYLLPIFKNAARPVIAEMKKNAPVSKNKSFTTKHRDYKNKSFTWKNANHKSGELRRSIKVTQSKKTATIYMGPTSRAGSNSDAWYWLLVSLGHRITRTKLKRIRIKGNQESYDKRKSLWSSQGFAFSKPNDYLMKSWARTKDQMISKMTADVEKLLMERLS